MLRNDLTDGLLVWLPNNDEEGPALVLDGPSELDETGKYRIFNALREGGEIQISEHDTLKSALLDFVQRLE